MSLQSSLRYLARATVAGESRDLGAAKTKGGGEVTRAFVKDRPAGGEDETVAFGLGSQANVTLLFEYARIRSNYEWLKRGTLDGTATGGSIVGQQLSGRTVVGSTEELTATPIRVGEIPADANSNEKATVEVEFVIGTPS